MYSRELYHNHGEDAASHSEKPPFPNKSRRLQQLCCRRRDSTSRKYDYSGLRAWYVGYISSGKRWSTQVPIYTDSKHLFHSEMGVPSAGRLHRTYLVAR